MAKKTEVEVNDEQNVSPANPKGKRKKKWQKPKLEDVSGKVMAQPYIRFT